MPNIEVNVFNQKLKLSYQEDEKKRILKAVEILNNNWIKLSHLHGKVSDIKIATLISLEIQDSIEDIKILKDNIKAKETDNALLKKEIDLKREEFQEIKNTLKKLESEIEKKNQDLLNLENTLDEFLNELLEIKNKILKNE